MKNVGRVALSLSLVFSECAFATNIIEMVEPWIEVKPSEVYVANTIYRYLAPTRTVHVFAVMSIRDDKHPLQFMTLSSLNRQQVNPCDLDAEDWTVRSNGSSFANEIWLFNKTPVSMNIHCEQSEYDSHRTKLYAEPTNSELAKVVHEFSQSSQVEIESHDRMIFSISGENFSSAWEGLDI